MSRKLRMLACGGVFSIALSIAPSALGAPTLTLSTGPDPAESITTQLLASGSSASTATRLNETVKPTGGQGCGSNFSADAGAGGSIVFDEKGVVEGPFSASLNYTFDSGSYLLCGWLNDGSQTGSPVVATASLTFSVRPPHLALSISAPSSVTTGQSFQIVTTAQAEVARSVREYLLPNTGRGCPANQAAAASTSGVTPINWPTHYSGWSVEGGPFAESANVTLSSAGQYLVCAYIQYRSEQSPPELTASAMLTAISPPPPCVVPALSATTKLKYAEQAIRSAGCSVGTIRRAASRRVRAGYVVTFSSTVGKRLAPGAAVNLTISTGPPCIVPRVSAGTTLSLAERRLLANHCSLGKLSATSSRRYRVGRVLRLGARAGQVLPSHAAITVLVARRHR